MTLRTVVIAGASLAGLRGAEMLRREGFDGRIVIIGAEEHPPYDRPPLSKQFLAGSMDWGKVVLRADDDLDLDWRLSTQATGLDLQQRIVNLGSGDSVAFDGLMIATGAHPRTLPGLPDLAGVFVLRTANDSVALRDALSGSPRVAVVGAGFIGSEVAATCHGRGLDVTVVEALPVPLGRAIGETMGARCGRLHLENGVDLRLGVGVAGLVGSSRVEGVSLADGSVVPADVVVIGVGVAPTTGWLEGSGVDLADGVRCDRWCRVIAGGHPLDGVVAAGDVARWDHPGFGEAIRVEHWTNAVEMGQAAALTLLRGTEAPAFDPVPYFWSDQYGTKIQFVGRTGPDVAVVDGAVDDDRFVVAYGHHGRLVGALGFSRPAVVMKHRALIAAGAPFPTSM